MKIDRRIIARLIRAGYALEAYYESGMEGITCEEQHDEMARDHRRYMEAVDMVLTEMRKRPAKKTRKTTPTRGALR